MFQKRIKAWILQLTLRLLLKHLDLHVAEKDALMDEWLAASWMTPGFRKYLGYREGRIIFEMSGGANLTEIGQLDYTRHMGSRLEMLALGVHAKNAHTRKERLSKQRIENQQKEEQV
jgi:hypothetical protein